jgi:uncharacterized protein HemY
LRAGRTFSFEGPNVAASPDNRIAVPSGGLIRNDSYRFVIDIFRNVIKANAGQTCGKVTELKAKACRTILRHQASANDADKIEYGELAETKWRLTAKRQTRPSSARLPL